MSPGACAGHRAEQRILVHRIVPLATREELSTITRSSPKSLRRPNAPISYANAGTAHEDSRPFMPPSTPRQKMPTVTVAHVSGLGARRVEASWPASVRIAGLTLARAKQRMKAFRSGSLHPVFDGTGAGLMGRTLEYQPGRKVMPAARSRSLLRAPSLYEHRPVPTDSHWVRSSFPTISRSAEIFDPASWGWDGLRSWTHAFYGDR